MYQLLKDYATVHNHTWPTYQDKYKGANLGRWVYTQRHHYRLRQQGQSDASTSSMCDEHITLLNSIGFVWDLSSRLSDEATSAVPNGIDFAKSEEKERGSIGKGSEWDFMYQLLNEFGTENNHISPSLGVLFKGQKLGDWVDDQRNRYRLRQQEQSVASTSIMCDEQVTLLNRIGFVWDLSSRLSDEATSAVPNGIDFAKSEEKDRGSISKGSEWDFMYQLLNEYGTENNHISPSQGVLFKGQKLGDWVVNQRNRYRLRQNGQVDASSITISHQQINRLDEIGFVWDLENQPQAVTDEWDSMFELLIDYGIEYDHLCPSVQELYKGQKLGQWVNHLRLCYQGRGKRSSTLPLLQLSDQRIGLLNEIGFKWDVTTPVQGKASIHGKVCGIKKE
eukprot:CAMPEP_0198154782 /NCGR_PEP_ID=MMETSP1443-20131203/68787_1 /TAXON_ID=186043 /ORGANISM="Entomoneis sp., Strain CCMP2396" /LENGTH=391 /DNA_ID=CAMNT_0043821491 /DNA_START=794 /DNA_END=1969 /DNA_ORIENTATION=-